MMSKQTYNTFIFLSILPLVYVSTTLEIALICGVILFVVTLAIKGLSRIIGVFSEGRINVYASFILTAGIISLLTIILQTYLTVDNMIGLYLSLILFNIGIIGDASSISMTAHLKLSGISVALLLVIGLLREVLGAGQLGLPLLGLDTIQLFDAKYAITFLTNASGGFILTGIIFAIFNVFNFGKKEGATHVN